MRLIVALGLVGLVGSVAVAGTPRHGLNYTNNDNQNSNLDKIDKRMPFVGVPQHSVVLCGQLGNNGTVFLGPANVADATGENGEGSNAQASAGGAVCNGLGSATEATADAPMYTNLRATITAMYCKAVTDSGATGSGANGVVFTLRSDAANTVPVASCTVPTGAVECIWTPTTAALPVISAASTIAVKAVSTEDVSANDGWCRVFYSVN